MAQQHESPRGTTSEFRVELAVSLRMSAKAAGMSPERYIVWCVERHARDQTDLAMDELAEWGAGRPPGGLTPS